MNNTHRSAEQFFEKKKHYLSDRSIPDYLRRVITEEDAKQYAIRFAIEQLEEANNRIHESIGDEIGDGYKINLAIIEQLKSSLTQ